MNYEWLAFSQFLQDVLTIVETSFHNEWALPRNLPFGKLPSFLTWIKEKKFFVLFKLFWFYGGIIIPLHLLHLFPCIIADELSGFL